MTKPSSRKLFSVMMALLLVLPLGAVLVPTDAAASHTGSAAVTLEAHGNIIDSAAAGDGETLLQFTAGGHVLGFGKCQVYVGSMDHVLRVEFAGGTPVQPVAEGAGTAQNGAPPLGSVTYNGVWPGVDIVYSITEGGISESTYYLSYTDRGLPVDNIRLHYNRPLSLDGQGNLVIAFDNGCMLESAPVAWQEVNGVKRTVAASFVLYGEQEVGFALKDYLPGIPVVIDPVLTWNTFLGGASTDYGFSIAVDGSGNVYVAGYSFATWGSPVRAYTGGTDAFAARLNGATGTLVWNTFLGGSGLDYGLGIAVDGSGNVYVAGYSNATWGNPVRAYTGIDDVFAARLNGATGALVWNTFLGSAAIDYGGWGIAVDSSGNVYVAGLSKATWGSPVRVYTGTDDAFAARLNGATGALVWNTFLGGAGSDNGRGITVDGSGNVYVAGFSTATWGSPVRAYMGGTDAFATGLNGATGALVWNTFLGGAGTDDGYAITVDGSGNVYVAGQSWATWGSPVRAYTGIGDAFAAGLNGATGALVWNTFLGSASVDYGQGIAVDGSGNVYVAGRSDATWGSPVRAYTGIDDAFAAGLNGATGALVWNTFLGGAGLDDGWGIAADISGNVYVAGLSAATWGNPVRAYTGNGDAFVVGFHAPTVTTQAAAGVTTNSAILNMSYTVGGYSSVDVRFAYKKAAEAVWTYTSWVSKTADGTHAEPLTGLNSSTIYDFQAQLQYDSTIIEGDTLQFTTASPAKRHVSPSPSQTPQLPPSDVHLNNVSVSPGQAQSGQPVTVLANLVNTGASSGSYNVMLRINGKVEQQRTVEVSPGTAYPVRFTVTKSQPGTYDVAIEGQRASFMVVGDSTSRAPTSGGLIALMAMAVLVLAAVIVLMMTFRRPA